MNREGETKVKLNFIQAAGDGAAAAGLAAADAADAAGFAAPAAAAAAERAAPAALIICIYFRRDKTTGT